MKFLLLITLLLFSTIASSATYYVKNGGSDSNTGLSDAQAWATVSKVNSFTFATSDDVYFKQDSQWREQLVVDWAGTSGDKVIIGTYYMSGSETYGVQSGHAKARFYGTYPNLTNTQDPTWSQRLFEVSGAIPSSRNGALVTVSTNYVTITNIAADESAGLAFLQNSSTHDILFDTVSSNATAAGQVLIKSGTYDSRVTNSSFNYCGLIVRDTYANHPSCVLSQYSAKNIIDKNVITRAFGEGIGYWGAGANYGIVKDNLLAGIFSVGIYVGNSHDVIIENNIIVGDPSGEFERDYGIVYPGPGISLAAEDYQINDIIGFTIRNNFIAGTYRCLNMGLFSGVPGTVSLGGQFIGNTCVGNGTGVQVWPSAVFHASGFEIANNIFADSDTDCNSSGQANLTFHHNVWDVLPSDTDCRGTGDVTGNPTFNYTGNFRNFSPSNIPSISDFSPTAAVTDVGDPMQSTIITLANYSSFYADLDNPVGTKELEYDYQYTTRNITTPDIGAIEGTVSPDTPLTAPAYINIGGGAVTVDSTNYVADTYYTGSCAPYATDHVYAISNTVRDVIYQTGSGSGACAMQWTIPMTNGSYDVSLMFAEPYWGNIEGTCSGSERAFDISMQGIKVRDEFTPCLYEGAALTAYLYTKGSVVVSDGQLIIALEQGTTGSVDNKPELFGVQIVTANPTGPGSLSYLTTGVATVNNIYPSAITVNPKITLAASTTIPGQAITISALDTGGITCGTAVISSNLTDIIYTPANASAGSCGSMDVTLSDSVDTGLGTISLVLTNSPTISPPSPIYSYYLISTGVYGKVLLASATNLCYTITKSRMEYTSQTDMYTPASCDGTTDANGKFSFSNEWLVADQAYTVYLRYSGVQTFSGHKILDFSATLPPVRAH